MSDSKQLAILLPNLRIGGAERVAIELVHKWVGEGHKVDLVLMRGVGELLPLLPPEVRVIDLNARRIRSALRPLIKYLAAVRPDAIQISMWPLTILGIIAHRLARSSGRVVVSEHVTLSRQYADLSWIGRQVMRRSIAFFYPLASARVAVSRGAADDLAQLSGIPRHAITVVYNPVQQFDVDAGTDIHRLWGVTNFRILTVGMLKSQKNQRLLIEAFARLPAHCGARLMLLGNGPLLGELRDVTERLGVAGKVIFQPSDLDPGPYYRSADLFVLASDYEGFGLVLVEALLSGLPVVSTDCESGPREILGDGEFGTLVPCGDAATLATAIEAALDAPVNHERQMERGRLFSGADSPQRYLELMIG